MKKIKLSFLVFVLSLFTALVVSAHAGHEHPEEGDDDEVGIGYFEAVQGVINKEFTMTANDVNIGNFIIKKVRGSDRALRLSVEVTYSSEASELTKNIRVNLGENKILSFPFSTGIEDYVVFIDFQNLVSGFNNGVRVIYSTKADADRTIEAENISVSSLVE